MLNWFKSEPKRLRGAYYAEDHGPGAVYPSHAAWWGAQRMTAEGFLGAAEVRLNEVVRHCRIGKITMKATG